MNDIYVVGIDPGLGGGFSIINQKSDGTIVVEVHSSPVIRTKATNKTKAKNEYDIFSIAKTLRPLENKNVHVCLEKVSAMPGQGTVSMFHFGEGFGIWKGIIGTLGFKLALITPMTWKSEWQDKLLKKMEKPDILRLKPLEIKKLSAVDLKKYKEVKKQHKKNMDQAKKLSKDNARELAGILYPNLREEFKLKKDDGKAEALLIAEYTRRKINANEP